MTRSGRLFQTRAAATGKARSPTVRSRVRLTISDEDELERSRSLLCARYRVVNQVVPNITMASIGLTSLSLLPRVEILQMQSITKYHKVHKISLCRPVF